jgi:hypothetical protein
MPTARWAAASLLLMMLGAGLAAAQERGPGQTTPLPPGHPPIGGSGAGSLMPPPTAGGGEQQLVWTTPKGWTSEAPSSPMRRAQYRIAGPGGLAECAVFYFGPGQGGGADANATRWASQFRGSAGSPVGHLKQSKLKIGDISVLLVEVTGIYVGGGMGGTSGPERPDYMLLGAIAETPDANWFFRALGPRATLEAQRKAFEGMVRSIKLGKST